MTETYDGGRLAEDLRTLVDDAEALLRATSNAGNEVQEHAKETLQDLRLRLSALEERVRERAHEVDSFVRDNPWSAVAVVGGVALFIGILMGRR